MAFFATSFFLLAYTLFAYSSFRKGVFQFSYSSGFFIFMTIQYGPHTVIYTDLLRLSVTLANDKIGIIYGMIVGAFYFFYSIFILCVPRKFMLQEVQSIQLELGLRGRERAASFFLFAFLVIVSLILQPGLSVTLKHIEYMLGDSFFSYTEIRRVIFEGTAWSSFASLVRFTIVPIVFGYIIVAFYYKGAAGRILGLLVGGVLFFVVAVQLNKFYFLFFGVMFFLVRFQLSRKRAYSLNFWRAIKGVPIYLMVLLLFIFIVYRLYIFQYGDALASGKLSTADIVGTLLFRVFFASSDSLRLWIEHFYFRDNFAGLSTVGFLCNIFADSCVNINAIIPQIYMDRDLTTMQSGFLGTTLSTTGIFSLPLVSFFVAGLVCLNNYVQLKFTNSMLYIPISVHLFLAAFFITTRELSTAMLSGGASFIAIAYLVIYKFKFR